MKYCKAFPLRVLRTGLKRIYLKLPNMRNSSRIRPVERETDELCERKSHKIFWVASG